jgi:cytochrome bd-type quinol oxidase subunit 2
VQTEYSKRLKVTNNILDGIVVGLMIITVIAVWLFIRNEEHGQSNSASQGRPSNALINICISTILSIYSCFLFKKHFDSDCYFYLTLFVGVFLWFVFRSRSFVSWHKAIIIIISFIIMCCLLACQIINIANIEWSLNNIGLEFFWIGVALVSVGYGGYKLWHTI